MGGDNSSQTYGGVISGTGNITQSGNRHLHPHRRERLLSGTDTIAGGTQTISGAGQLAATTKIANNGVFNYNSSANFTNTGINTGTGVWNINGPMFVLTPGGTSTFTGNIVVNGGILSDTDAPGSATASGFGNQSVATRTITVNNGAIISLTPLAGMNSATAPSSRRLDLSSIRAA